MPLGSFICNQDLGEEIRLSGSGFLGSYAITLILKEICAKTINNNYFRLIAAGIVKQGHLLEFITSGKDLL